MRDRIAGTLRRRVGVVGTLVVLACAFAGVGAARAEGPTGGALRSALAGRTLTAVDGTKLTMASLDGQVVVVNFWATWCKPCRREMPRLAELDRTLSRRGGRALAISIDEDPENVRRFAKSLGLELPLYCDGPKGLVRTLDLAHIPTTFVLDRDGTIVHRSSGSTDADLDRLAAVTERLIGGTQSAGGGAE